ncbi:hypothetical protein, partial [Helicobacter vulpis]|uniref:hypothetical protein n=1 Tax=Helicobacter vulpis TaxID=2316076 RepID=UPI0013CE361F
MLKYPKELQQGRSQEDPPCPLSLTLTSPPLHNTLFTPYTLEQELPKLYNFAQTQEQAKAI